jgi:hypothetical protein
MQTVGSAWLTVSLSAGPMYVALTQSASALPFFVFALPAGAIGDIVDRRKLILFTETWMLLVAVLLASLTLAGFMSPLMLLILTFALSAGEDWVRARVLAVSMLVFQGAVAAGSAAWGALAGRVGIDNALLWGGVGTMATAVLGLWSSQT